MVGRKKNSEEIAALVERSERTESTLGRIMMERALGKTHGGARDMYEVLGYKRHPNYIDYQAMYDRQDVAKRIVDCFPDTIWTRKPAVRTDPEAEELSEFDTIFNTFARKHKLFHYLNRLDKMAGIGRYAVLLIGIAGKQDMTKAVSKRLTPNGIIYLRPFSEKNATIQKYETRKSSPRYGLPLLYQLTVGSIGNEAGASASTVMPQETIMVHHSRIIHLADGALDNDVFGTPRLQSVINRLNDLEKVAGGSAEIFWINGRGGLNVNAQMESEIKEPEKLIEHLRHYVHGLVRVLRTKGMDVKTLEFEVKNPDMHVSVLLDLISSATGIPKRILIGSERGELASNQDENNWFSRVNERRDNFCEPQILRAFIDRMIDWGVFPRKEYEVVWPPLSSPSKSEEADNAFKKAQAIGAYAGTPMAEYIVPPEQFVKDVLGLEFRGEDAAALAAIEKKNMEAEAAASAAAKPAPVAGGGATPKKPVVKK